jgi:hypothetical protein
MRVQSRAGPQVALAITRNAERAADEHRHAHGFGLFNSQPHILVRKAGREGEVEVRGMMCFGKLSCVALLRPLLLLMTSAMMLRSRPALTP